MSYPTEYEAANRFSVRRERIFAARVTADGTPSGDPDMTGDYSVTPGRFWTVVPPGVNWHITSMVIYIAGSGSVTANNYGPISALNNGMALGFEDQAGTPIQPPFTLDLKHNGDFQQVGMLLTVQDTGPGVNHVTFTVDWESLFGTALVLKPGEGLSARPADDMTSLASHRATISGYTLITP